MIEARRQDARDAQQKVREAEAALYMAEAALKAVQMICLHPNAEEWQTSCMGDIGHHWECKDCGKERNT